MEWRDWGGAEGVEGQGGAVVDQTSFRNSKSICKHARFAPPNIMHRKYGYIRILFEQKIVASQNFLHIFMAAGEITGSGKRFWGGRF